MKLKYFENKGSKKYELLLHGIIGVDVNGSEIAKEIQYLNTIDTDEIVERINSIGGDVIQGYSIIAANLNSKAKVVTICEGVADSIASLIFATGDVRKIMEYGSILIHNVSFDGVSLNDIEDEKIKSEAITINDSLINILANKCGGKKKIKDWMDQETRFSAQDAIDNNFADEMVLIGRGKNKPAFTESLTRRQFMNICNEFAATNGQMSNYNNNKMEKVLEFLNLSKEASETAVLEAVKALKAEAAKVSGLQAKVTGLEAEKKEAAKLTAESTVNNLIEKGYFDKGKKDELVNMAVESPEAFTKITNAISPVFTNISAQLEQGSGKKMDNKTEDAKKMELAKEYQKLADSDPAALRNLEITDKAKFDNMYNAWAEVDLPAEKE